MQAAGNERGDLSRNQYPSGSALDADATRAFHRDTSERTEALPGAEATQVLSRPAGRPGGRPAAPARRSAAPEPTGRANPLDGNDLLDTADVANPVDPVDPGVPLGPVGAGPADATQKFQREPVADSPQPPRRGQAAGTTQPMRRGSPPPAPPRERGPTSGRPPRRRFLRKRWVLVLLLVVVILIPLGTWGRVWYTARQDERPVSDAIVVLGASQYDGRPSPIFEARLNHAAELYYDGVAPAIVTVGGNQPGDNFTEGEAGRNWLIDIGIPAEQVVAVPEGGDTLDSLEAVAFVFEEFGWSSAVIVTDPWHALRSRVIAENSGMEAATSPSRSGPAVQTRETQLWYITRETASLMYYRIFGKSSDIRVDAA